MDASRPLLATDRDEDDAAGRRPYDCLPRWRSPSPRSSGGGGGSSGGAALSSASSTSSSTDGDYGGSSRAALLGSKHQARAYHSQRRHSHGGFGYQHDDAQYAYVPHDDADDAGRSLLCCGRRRGCAEWPCWRWLFPERVHDYDDFASAAQMGEIYLIRQKAREFFEPSNTEDEEMLQHLWNGLFPTLPYDGRVNSRWRDVGFQNADPASDLRSSGRLALQMLLYFADHLNDEFKRMMRENRFPVCLSAINLLEVLLSHLKLKDPIPLVCPCCGTENAELETAQRPSRSHAELKGFANILDDVALSAHANSHLVFSEWPVEVALAQVFMHAMIVLDAVWTRQLQRDPTTTLLHFREALLDTRVRLVAFLSRRNSPVSLAELHAWSYRLRGKLKSRKAV